MDERIKQLYEEAKKRAMERNTEWNAFTAEAMEGYLHGITAVFDRAFQVDYDRIKSESTYGYAFVQGMLSKREAVKGKSYGASWQKKGEPGALKQVQRKTDRSEIALELQALGRPPEEDESLSETIGDNAVYNGKWLTLRNELDRNEFMQLIVKIREKG